MRQGEIMHEPNDPMLLRNYLLGTLDDEIVRARIEERLMVDDEFATSVGVIEEELIEEFLDGEMSPEESDKFNRFFLAPPERMRQLRLTRDLRRVSAANADNYSPHRTSSQHDRIGSIGWLRFAVAAVVVVVAALGFWRIAIYQSDTDKGLAELRAAYRANRPVESRITALPNYAPYSEGQRGAESSTDPTALEKASRYLFYGASDSNGATAHQALANFHLAARDFEKAEREMELALKSDPKDSRIQNDAGAMYLEMAKDVESTDYAKAVVLLNDSLRHLDAAIGIDPKLKEAHFNRALALTKLTNTEEAKAEWRKYLELDRDADSKWAAEAQEKLQELERATPRERTAEQLEKDFVAAFRDGNEVEASALVRQNRELIKDKYLPMRLAMSFLNAPEDRRDELLNALEYSGKIEMKLTGDSFAKDIAHFYRTVPTAKWTVLAEGHKQLRNGISFCANTDYKQALAAFEESRKLFEESGDNYDDRLAQYFIGYASKNISRRNDAAHAEFKQLADWAAERKYQWLRMTALHWAASCLLDQKQVTESRRTAEEALSISRSLGDSYGLQRNLMFLAQLHSICGQEQTALRYVLTALKESEKPDTSQRQRLRDLFLAVPVLFEAKLYSAGKPAALEAIHVADEIKDPMWMPHTRSFAGLAASLTGEPDRARALFEESIAKANAVEYAPTRELVTAFSNLRHADFERSLGNFDAAESLYRRAAEYYDNESKFPLLGEQTHEGMLLTYLAAKKFPELEEQIPVNIRLNEEYRDRIADAEMSVGFFDSRGTVYDVAAKFEFDRGNIERAYDYAEESSSRTLLDQMRTRTVESSANDNSNTAPLGLKEIREQMPAGVRILQYSVFQDKTVAWIISQASFNVVEIPIKRQDLQDRVSEFAKAVSHGPSTDDAEFKQLSGDLYQLLMQPVMLHLDSNEELCIIPSGVLFDVPFATLSDRNGAPLISSFRILYAPSANVFIECTRHAEARAGAKEESILAVGNPTFKRDAFENLPYLDNAENEVRQISGFYPRRQELLRERATKTAFMDEIQRADVVHFAGHYVAMPGAPMSSYLLFAADGDDPVRSELSNRDLLQTSLPRTRLMVLAACDSGIESYYRSQGMAGMSRTMLAAQVPLVVASQWSVDSSVTARLMTRFHELRTTQRMSTTAALRQAQLDLLNDPTGRFRSPYYWAAFAVYGGHASY